MPDFRTVVRHAGIARVLMLWLVAIAAALPLFSTAQVGPASPASAVPGGPDPAAVRKQLDALDSRGDLDAAAKKKVAETLKSALAELDRAADTRKRGAALRERLAGSAAEIERLERTINRPPDIARQQPDRFKLLTTNELERLEADARTAVGDGRTRLIPLDRAIENALTRPITLRREQNDARATLDRLRADTLESRKLDRGTTAAQVQSTLIAARMQAELAHLELLEQEQALQPALNRMLQLERDIARRDLARAEDELKLILAAKDERRVADAQQSREQALRDEATLAAKPAPLRRLAEANLATTTALAETAATIERIGAQRDEYRRVSTRLQEEVALATQRAAAIGVSSVFADYLFRGLQRLPATDKYASAREEREHMVAEISAALFEAERERRALANRDIEATVLAKDLPENDRRGFEREYRDLARARDALLARLIEEREQLLQTLREADDAEDDVRAQVTEARQQFTQLMFWVPIAPVNLAFLEQVGAGIKWLATESTWVPVWRTLAADLQRSLPLYMTLAAIVIVLIAMRKRMRSVLAATGALGKPIRDNEITLLFRALAITALLALPLPLALGFIGARLESAPLADVFTQGTGRALVWVAWLTVTGLGFAWLFRRDGVAINHFGWHADSTRAAARGLHTLMWLLAPLTFVAIISARAATQIERSSLGRLALVIAMFGVTAFFARLLRFDRPPMREILATHPRSLLARLRHVWYLIAVAIPLALALMTLAGYYFAAANLFARLLYTLVLLLSALVLYGFMSRWVVVQRARLARSQAVREQLGADQIGAVEGVAVKQSSIDVFAIGDQSRRMLTLLILILVAVGLWMVWRNAIPAFEVLGKINLWSYDDTVDGEQVTRPLTLGGLAVAAVIGLVTLTIVRNLGSILDITLLQRLALRPDANYAISTIARYVIAGIGVVWALSTLGVSWNKLQWLVAALGVGLGFGLQEIVANFVSGLIVLFERPVRIGDTVTVGDVTGVVSRIRARATMVTDADNKEVLIPNKAFITDRVTNWTLSTPITRVMLRVGVAYGTDVLQAYRLIQDTVKACPLVLREPEPSVFLVGFGDSSLDFEVRAFANGMDARQPLRHELHVAIERVLRENDIEIPFPQQDVHFRSEVPVEATPVPVRS